MKTISSAILQQAGFVKSKIAQVIAWVAGLDGATQHWEMNTPIVIPAGADFEISSYAVASENNGDKPQTFIASDDDGQDFWFYREALIPNRAMVRLGNSQYIRFDFDKDISGAITLKSNGLNLTASMGGQEVTKPASMALDGFNISVIGKLAGFYGFLSGYISHLMVKINNTLTHSIPLTNKDQGEFQVATTTPLGENLYTKEIIENPASAGSQWAYLGGGRWQIIGDGTANVLQFITQASMPDTGYVQFEIESISGGSLRCTENLVSSAVFSSEGVKSYYYSSLAEAGAIQFKRSPGAVQAVIKNIKHFDAEGALVATMANYTEAVWKKVRTIDVGYLDGATQFWQLSGGGITIPEGADFKVNLNASALLSGVWMNILGGGAFRLNVASGGSGRDNVILDMNGSRIVTPENSWNPTDGIERNVEMRRRGGVVSISVDGLDSTNTILFEGEIVISRLGKDGVVGGDSYFEGYERRLTVSINNTLTNEIPLTNKFQGANQRATVGNVHAFMPNFTGAVFRKETVYE